MQPDLLSWTPPADAVEIQPLKDMVFQGRRPIDRKGRPVLPGQSQILANDAHAFIRLKGDIWTIIDREDFDLVKGKTWTPRRKGKQIYVGCGKIYLHRLIRGNPDKMHVDHRDVNGLNNRRYNLRICTQAQNNKNLPKPYTNTSGFKGVSFRKDRGKYSAKIRGPNGRTIALGCFDDPIAAHAAYVAASQKYHGEFGRAE